MSAAAMAEAVGLVQYVVVRGDLQRGLGWPLGAVLAQACHACTAAIHIFYHEPHTQQYLQQLDSMHKVVLEVPDEQSLTSLSQRLSREQVDHRLWVEQPENVATCLALRPCPREQTFTYNNGFPLPVIPRVGIGRQPITTNQLSQAHINQLANQAPTLTYGQARQAAPADFIPGHVAFDKKVLRFNGYFKQTVHESPQEYYRVRPVVLYYYLEDDSMAISEPHRDNAGMPQGMIIKRQRVPKNQRGDHYHWTDFNLGIDLVIYGRKYHVTDCDKFTQDFMESSGLILNCPEPTPPDPYLTSREIPPRQVTTRSTFDKLQQFLQFDRKVLRFYAYWDGRCSELGECRRFVIEYYLADDTVEIREVYEPNDGKDPFPVFMGRRKLAKNMDHLDPTFPLVALEVSAREVSEWFSPRDFIVGQHVTILNRRFFIYDCDQFTCEYYRQNVLGTELRPVDVTEPPPPPKEKYVPPYNGFGSPEDSLQNYYSLIPRPPRKDVIKMLENSNKELRYEARLETRNPEDSLRRFVLRYHLDTDTISIFEPHVKNSGTSGGKFLQKSRVRKPGSSDSDPEYYTAKDLAICATVEVLGRRFVITDADQFVYKYVEDHPELFTVETVSSFQRKKMELGLEQSQHLQAAGLEKQQEHTARCVSLCRAGILDGVAECDDQRPTTETSEPLALVAPQRPVVPTC